MDWESQPLNYEHSCTLELIENSIHRAHLLDAWTDIITRRHEDAIKSLQQLSENSEIAHICAYGMARIAQISGREEDAKTLYTIAAEANPCWPAPLVQLSRIQTSKRNYSAARELARSSLERRTGYAAAWAALADVERASGNFGAALDANTRSINAGGVSIGRAIDQVELYLLKREYYAAFKLCEDRLGHSPGHTRFLAYKGIALWHLGKLDEWKELMSAKLWSQSQRLHTSAKQNNSYNIELMAALNKLEKNRDPQVHSTRGGMRTNSFENIDSEILQDLTNKLATVAQKQLLEYRERKNPVFDRELPTEFELRAWAVFLEPGGQQIPHMHPSAMLSGVYYVQAPCSAESLNACAPDGYLELCHREHYGPPDPANDDFKLVAPEPGTLAVFPSYLWHATIPFKSPDVRVSIGFDAVPL